MSSSASSPSTNSVEAGWDDPWLVLRDQGRLPSPSSRESSSAFVVSYPLPEPERGEPTGLASAGESLRAQHHAGGRRPRARIVLRRRRRHAPARHHDHVAGHRPPEGGRRRASTSTTPAPRPDARIDTRTVGDAGAAMADRARRSSGALTTVPIVVDGTVYLAGGTGQVVRARPRRPVTASGRRAAGLQHRAVRRRRRRRARLRHRRLDGRRRPRPGRRRRAVVDRRHGHRLPTGIDIQPVVVGGLVLVSSVPISLDGIYTAGDRGVVYALDAATGEVRVDLRHRRAATCGATPRSTPAAAPGTRRRWTTSAASCTSASPTRRRSRARRSSPTGRAARATTCTPTPSSPSTSPPASCSGTTR